MAAADPHRYLISELISPPTVVLRLRGRQRDEILREMVSSIPEIQHRPEAQDLLFRALLEREQLHSTGIGEGVALPHARNALVGLVDEPVIVFGRHDSGVPYGAIDGQVARLFFLLVSTTVTQHLQILARISRLLRDHRLRQDLLLADRTDRVLELIRTSESRM